MAALLTSRESPVLMLIRVGYSNTQIAHRLSIAEVELELVLRGLCAKLDGVPA